MFPDLERIKKHNPLLIGEKEALKAAVCIALIENGDDYDVLFEVRSSSIPRQPGEVCLPGGVVEEGETYEETAVRETCEELLILPEQIQIIGASDIMFGRNRLVYPYVGILKDYQGTFSEREVAKTFRVPLLYLKETPPEMYAVETSTQYDDRFPDEQIWGNKSFKGYSQKSEEIYYLYEGHVIWGMTARIITAFLKLI